MGNWYIKGIIMAICKSRHWNLGIGIGIGNRIGIETDITNVIISSSIRLMDPKLSRVVTWDERTPLTKSRDTLITLSRYRSKALCFNFHKAYGPQT